MDMRHQDPSSRGPLVYHLYNIFRVDRSCKCDFFIYHLSYDVKCVCSGMGHHFAGLGHTDFE